MVPEGAVMPVARQEVPLMFVRAVDAPPPMDVRSTETPEILELASVTVHVI